MALQFTIPNGIPPKSAQTLASGFGLPLVQRALIGNIATQPQDEHNDSRFGTPVYDWIFIQRPEYNEYTFNELTKTYDKTPVIPPNNKTLNGELGFYCEGVIIEANRQRNIVTTQVSGYNDGSIVEYINNGDWSITIRGFINSKFADVYPRADVQTLLSYCSAPVPLKITSKFINDVLGVSYIIPTTPNVFQQQGLRNVQFFEISCISNIPYTITQNA
jgi:hypothetical protein